MKWWQWFVPGVREYNLIKDMNGARKQQQQKQQQQQQQKNRVDEARDYLDKVVASAPGEYKSQYSDQINQAQNKLNQINKNGFRYDFTKDAAYEQYKNRYERGAQLASEDAASQAASRSGGFGNSWSASAGQNAYQSTMNGLAGVSNDLYNQAYGEYNQRKNDLSNQIGALQQQDALAQQAHREKQSAYESQLAYAQNEYTNALNQKQAKQRQSDSWWQTGLNIAAAVLPWLVGIFL